MDEEVRKLDDRLLQYIYKKPLMREEIEALFSPEEIFIMKRNGIIWFDTCGVSGGGYYFLY